MPDRCPIPADELLALYETMSTRKIGRYLGGSNPYMPETVTRWLRARGAKIRLRGGKNNPNGLGGKSHKRA